MMKPKLLLCLALVLSGALAGCVTHKPEEIVEQMRGFDMQPSNPMLDDGKIDSKEQHRQMIIGQFRMLGKESTPVLSHALQDSDVQMRRNAELVMIWLAGGYDGQPKMNIQEAIPALIKATVDGDSDVRAWAAQALAEIGPDVKDPVHRQSPRSKQGDLDRLQENGDAYYWYYRNVWLPTYLDEHHIQTGRTNTAHISAGSSAPLKPNLDPDSDAKFLGVSRIEDLAVADPCEKYRHESR